MTRALFQGFSIGSRHARVVGFMPWESFGVGKSVWVEWVSAGSQDGQGMGKYRVSGDLDEWRGVVPLLYVILVHIVGK